ncbi:MAG: ABC transporter substrate-binding protein [Anaerolineaceae bacterium]|nr:ABC transporter substrate-binding protein [Anaerolineaceae bacterium]MCB9100743.1 ABC transporter substrate-binding protein [Anaerolineales bacterium]
MFLTACSQPQAAGGEATGTVEAKPAVATEPAAAEPRVFVMTNLFDPDPLDPAKSWTTVGYTFHRNVYDPLVTYKLGTAEVEPDLATSWAANDDYTEWTFKLREGVPFQNSDDTVDAEDVVVTFNRVLAINQNQPGAILQGKLDSVEAVDDMTVRFKLNEPYVLFPAVLPKIGIVSAADVTAHEVDGDLAQAWFADNANGTGPYRLGEIVHGEFYRLERFDDWWNKAAFQPTAYDAIIVRPIEDSAVQRQLMERGDSCLGSWMSYRDMVEAAADSPVKLISGNSYLTLELIVSAAKPPMDNLLVRQAMVLAFPYEQFQNFYQGYSEIPRNVLSNHYPGADQSYEPLQQDLDRAKALLAEAGYSDGGFTVTMTAVEGLEDQRQAALLYQAALAQIGVTLEVQVLPFSVYFEQGQDPDTAATFNPQHEAPETADPFQWFDKVFGSDGLLNWTYQDVSAMDDLIDRGQSEPDEAARLALLHEAQQLATDNVYAFPIANLVDLDAVCDNTDGFVYQPTDLMYVPQFWPLYQVDK